MHCVDLMYITIPSYFNDVPDIDTDIFVFSDQNNDKKLTEVEVLSNPNKAMVWKWSKTLDKYPEMLKQLKSNDGMNLSEYISHYTKHSSGKYRF